MSQDLFGPEFLVERPLLAAIRAGDQAVLLVDELDRADDEFEAFLLEILSEFAVTIPEIGQVQALTPPAVVDHVEPDARAARRVEAAVPLPLDRSSRSRSRGRDRPHAGAARGARARARRRGGGGTAALARPREAPGRGRDDRLGERARVPRRGAAGRRGRRRHARLGREGPRGPGAGRRRGWPRWSGRMPERGGPARAARRVRTRPARAWSAGRHRPDPHVLPRGRRPRPDRSRVAVLGRPGDARREPRRHRDLRRGVRRVVPLARRWRRNS